MGVPIVRDCFEWDENNNDVWVGAIIDTGEGSVLIRKEFLGMLATKLTDKHWERS